MDYSVHKEMLFYKTASILLNSEALFAEWRIRDEISRDKRTIALDFSHTNVQSRYVRRFTPEILFILLASVWL